MKQIKSIVLFFVLLVVQLAYCNRSAAHFVFVYGEGGKVKVVFSEDLEPDQARLLAKLETMQAFTYTDGTLSPLDFNKVLDDDIGWLETDERDIVDVSCPFGVFDRGGTSMRLDYSAKYIRYQPQRPATAANARLALDVVPELTASGLKLSVYFKELSRNSFRILANLLMAYVSEK